MHDDYLAALRSYLLFVLDRHFERDEAELSAFADALSAWLYEFETRLMPDWRESLGAVLAEQAAAGRWLTPESHEELLDYLEAWWELAKELRTSASEEDLSNRGKVDLAPVLEANDSTTVEHASTEDRDDISSESDYNAEPREKLASANRGLIRVATRLLQSVTDEENALLSVDLARAARVLFREEMVAAADSHRIARMQYGNALERLVAERIGDDPILRRLYEHVGGANRPDFIGLGPFEGLDFDITTPQQADKHRERPGYGKDLNIIEYDRPAGFP